ncbi:glycosyltransferase family 4 protein [Alcaligenaceae bacterium]|nr:glycosyltransferase family 4 protein [Alcaligenaceae bacterium]
MKIALVTQYFWPETFSINDLVKSLVDQGHSVEVFTGKPNYPEGQVFDGYSPEGATTEIFYNSVPVHRAPLRPRGAGGAKNLVLNYLSFVYNGLKHFPRQAQGKDFDVILVFTLSPITSVIPAIYLKWRLKTHLAIWVLDLWPESLRATGFIKNRAVLGLVGCMVRIIYGCSDTILVQSRAFIAAVSRYTKRDKVFYYPNSHVDVPRFASDVTTVPGDVLQLMDENFCLVFTGNLGTAQALPTIIAAADQLRSLHDFRLVLVGSGSMSGWLQQQKQDLGLDNVILAGRYPAVEMPQFLVRASGLLVSLTAAEIFSQTVPAKIQSYLAAGRPIIASLNGEGAAVVLEARAGISCPAEDVDALVAAIKHLYDLPVTERQSLGRRGRDYFLKHFETNAQAAALVDVLQQRIAK